MEYITDGVASLPLAGVQARAGTRVLKGGAHQREECRSALGLSAEKESWFHLPNALLISIVIFPARRTLRMPAFRCKAFQALSVWMQQQSHNSNSNSKGIGLSKLLVG